MAFDLTLGITSANAGTRVVAVEVATGHVSWTVRVDDTLRPAFNIGIAQIFWRTLADTGVANLSRTNGANTTWAWVTRVIYNWFS